MKKITKVLTVLATSVLVALLILFIGTEFGHRGPTFAFLANWLVMSGVAMLGGVINVASFLPSSYFRIKEWEVKGRVYHVLGVRLFKRILVRTPFAALNSAIRYQGQRGSLAQLASHMRDAEASHLLIFCLMVMLTFYFAMRAWWDAAVWLFVFNVILNLYPIMLQRFNRGRLEPMINS